MHETSREMLLDGVIVRDPYRFVGSEQALQALLASPGPYGQEPVRPLYAAEDVLVPLPVMQACQAQIQAWEGRKGVLVQPGDELESFSADLPWLDLVAVHFPLFTDGRGHSLARTLRDHYGFKGELRAQGDVFEDTVHYLVRCGFNAFVPRPGVTPAQLLQGFDTFSESYQAAVDCPSPLFRRRTEAQPEGGGEPTQTPRSVA